MCAVSLQTLQAEKLALHQGMKTLEQELPLHDVAAGDKFKHTMDVCVGRSVSNIYWKFKHAMGVGVARLVSIYIGLHLAYALVHFSLSSRCPPLLVGMVS